MAPPVVTWEALAAWRAQMLVDLAPWEAELLVQLGQLRAAVLSEKAKQEARRPRPKKK